MPTLTTTADTFVYELNEVYDAETRTLASLRDLVEQVTDEAMRNQLTAHITETQGQITRLDAVVSQLGLTLQEDRRSSTAAGLIADTNALIRQMRSAPEQRDCAINAMQQKVELAEQHAYTILIQKATRLGYQSILPLLQQSLDEESLALIALQAAEGSLASLALAADAARETETSESN